MYGGEKHQHPAVSSRFPYRQDRQASEAIARRHGIEPSRIVIAQQHPEAIQAGVFHHDVIGLSHNALCLVHEKAFAHQDHVLEAIQDAYPGSTPLTIRVITSEELSLEDAVKTYFFNAQLVTSSDGTTHWIAPQECSHHPKTHTLLRELITSLDEVDELHFISLTESMSNGGGPACLRCRIPLTHDEYDQIPSEFKFTSTLYQELVSTVNNTYPDTFTLKDCI